MNVGQEKYSKKIQKLIKKLGLINSGKFTPEPNKGFRFPIKSNYFKDTLWVRVEVGKFVVSLSGTKDNDGHKEVYQYIKRDYDIKNTRNEEWKFSKFSEIEDIIYLYAGVKKKDIEIKFREYLENYTTLVSQSIDLYVDALKLDKSVYQTVKKKLEELEFPDFYKIDSINSFSEQHDQIQDIIPNQGDTNGNGDDNGNLSAGLGKYKLFLQYLAVIKQMSLYDASPDGFDVSSKLYWYFKIDDRNDKYPIKPICKKIAGELNILRDDNTFNTNAAKEQLKNIFQKNMEFYDSRSENKGYTMNNDLEEAINLLENKKQIILQGSPGTGKTYLAKQIAEQIAPDNYKTIQFHPAYSYEDFVRGIVAETGADGISYTVKNKVLAEMAENALKAPDEDYVLIIDEINRANLSSVLGELIYALEYRGEAVESMYKLDDNRVIILPENLYIIGTMNTADRSVGYIDYAIRRRFAFVNVNTDESVIPEKAKLLFEKVKKLFDNHLSEEFELNDVMIGHSYFLKDDLDLALKYEIKPILQEYRKDGVLTCEKSVIDDLNVN